MAALVQEQDGMHLAICGDLTPEEGRMLKSAAIFFLVRQGDNVVRGRGEYREGTDEWGACGNLTDSQLSEGPAVAMGTVVVERHVPFVAEKDDPAGFSDSFGFTTFTWMQDIMVQLGLSAGRIDPCAAPTPTS
jgi:hypothetical protein